MLNWFKKQAPYTPIDVVLPDAEAKIDTNSATWKYIVERIETELQKSRERNDKDLDIVKTAYLRGRIKLLKEISGWDKPDRKILE